ncbi:MAG: hypothetical protein NDJ75_08455, partial [Thermoanaerobaculia bacterium]|nr:hypothetical protein [Thermoanaerobaculia bacterium]
RWAVAQGAAPSWFDAPELPLAPHEEAILAPRDGWVGRIATRRLGELLGAAGGARALAGGEIDLGVALRTRVRLGAEVAAGDELARLYLRQPDPWLEAQFAACFEVVDERPAPLPLIVERVD